MVVLPRITGFEQPEIDILLDEAGTGPLAGADSIPEPEAARPSRPGDMWWINNHKLICGDALDVASYDRLLGQERAQMVFTDPPYDVPIAGHLSGLGQIRHREFAMATGEISRDAFTAFLMTVYGHLATYTRPTARCIISALVANPEPRRPEHMAGRALQGAMIGNPK